MRKVWGGAAADRGEGGDQTEAGRGGERYSQFRRHRLCKLWVYLFVNTTALCVWSNTEIGENLHHQEHLLRANIFY
jgi:hypothetical protein